MGVFCGNRLSSWGWGRFLALLHAAGDRRNLFLVGVVTWDSGRLGFVGMGCFDSFRGVAVTGLGAGDGGRGLGVAGVGGCWALAGEPPAVPPDAASDERTLAGEPAFGGTTCPTLLGGGPPVVARC